MSWHLLVILFDFADTFLQHTSFHLLILRVGASLIHSVLLKPGPVCWATVPVGSDNAVLTKLTDENSERSYTAKKNGAFLTASNSETLHM